MPGHQYVMREADRELTDQNGTSTPGLTTAGPMTAWTPSGEEELHAAGYEQSLRRSLSVPDVVALSVSDITPMASLLVIAPAVLAIAGTGGLLAYIIGCVIAVCVASCMAELGSMHPVAGGLYSIVGRVLGRPFGFVGLVDYIGQAVFLPAAIALGIGAYLSSLIPGINVNLAAALMMVAVTAIGCFGISFNARLIFVFLGIEMTVLTIIAIAGLIDLHQPLSILTHPRISGHGGLLASVGAGTVIAGVATTLFSFNGYDSAINFSEETQGSARNVGIALMWAAGIAMVAELVPFFLAVFGAPNLSRFLASATPLTDVIQTNLNGTVKDIVIAGALVAIFNAVLAITLQFGRILFASGRDRAWPTPISNALSRVNDRGAPWVSTLIVGTLATVLCFFSGLVTVVTFTSVLIIVLYALIAAAAIVSRLSARQRKLPRPFQMALWPAAPVIALAGVGVALSQQKASDLFITGAIVLGALLYYTLYLRPRAKTHWNTFSDPETELARLAERDV
ncbi:MAG: APC family permease [Solirubrobacterales bacterium]|nr:APC family permease [Solirubrobacterales bacterium]